MIAGMTSTSRRTDLLFFAISGTAGIAALFLPFFNDESPLSVLIDWFTFSPWIVPLCLLLLPFILPVLVSAAVVRLMVSGTLSRPERVIAYVLSVMMALGTNCLYGLVLIVESSEVWIWIIGWFIPLFILVFGAYVLIKNLRKNGAKEVSVIIAMETAYLNYALLMLLRNRDWQSGAYCVALTSALYLIQIVLTSAKIGVFRREGTHSREVND